MQHVSKNSFTLFVEESITDDGNLLDRMSKVNLLTWITAAKEVKRKAGSELETLKTISSLFLRMLLVARSPRANIDLGKKISALIFHKTMGH